MTRTLPSPARTALTALARTQTRDVAGKLIVPHADAGDLRAQVLALYSGHGFDTTRAWYQHTTEAAIAALTGEQRASGQGALSRTGQTMFASLQFLNFGKDTPGALFGELVSVHEEAEAELQDFIGRHHLLQNALPRMMRALDTFCSLERPGFDQLEVGLRWWTGGKLDPTVTLSYRQSDGSIAWSSDYKPSHYTDAGESHYGYPLRHAADLDTPAFFNQITVTEAGFTYTDPSQQFIIGPMKSTAELRDSLDKILDNESVSKRNLTETMTLADMMEKLKQTHRYSHPEIQWTQNGWRLVGFGELRNFPIGGTEYKNFQDFEENVLKPLAESIELAEAIGRTVNISASGTTHSLSDGIGTSDCKTWLTIDEGYEGRRFHHNFSDFLEFLRNLQSS